MIPAEITRGETVTWTTSSSYTSADGWTMTTYFRAASGPGVDVPAVGTGSNYSSTMTAAQSQMLAPGRCDWQTWASRGSGATLEQYKIAEGHTTIAVGFTDVDTSTPVDGRTPAEQQLDALRVALGQKAAKDTEEYQIANRMKRAYTFEDLLAWEKRLSELVNQERRAAAGGAGGSVFRNHLVRPVEPGP